MSATALCIPAFLEGGVPVGWVEFNKNLVAILDRWAKLDAQAYALRVKLEQIQPDALPPDAGTWLPGVSYGADPEEGRYGEPPWAELAALLLEDPDNAWVATWAAAYWPALAPSVSTSVSAMSSLCDNVRRARDSLGGRVRIPRRPAPGTAWLWGTSQEERQALAHEIAAAVLLCARGESAWVHCVRVPETQWAALAVEGDTLIYECVELVLMFPELRDPLRWASGTWAPSRAGRGKP